MFIYANKKLWSNYECSFLRVVYEANKEIAEKIIKYFAKDEQISPEAMEEAKNIFREKTW